MAVWTDPYSADGYVWIMKPRKVFQARVNLAGATYPLLEIPYDGVTLGSIDDVEMGMTVTLGTSEGGYDLGIHYVRGSETTYAVGDGTTLQCGYTSQGRRRGELDLIDDAYITVWDLFEVWKRAARSDKATGIIYKDGALLNDPTHLQPAAWVGGGIGQAGFVSSGVLAVDLDSSGSQFPGADAPTAFATTWDVKDGTITVGDDDDDTITAEFPPGYRWVKLLKEDSDGRTSLPRRYCIAGLEPSGDNAPLATVHKVKWSLKPDGCTLQADLRERIDPADYLPGTVVMLLILDDLGGFATKFAGYLDHWQSSAQGGISDTERQTTLFAVDVLGRAKQIQGFPSVQSRAPIPASPNEMPGASLSRYAWWILIYHTSIPMLADVDLNIARGDVFPFSRFASPGGSFFDICDHLAKAMGCDFTIDSRGRIALVPDPLRQESADRTSTVQRDITEGDWTRLERVKHPFPPVGLLKASATPASTINAADLATAIADWFAVAAGTVDGQGLGSDTVGYPQIARSELELWRRLGHDYARRNASEDLIRATLAHGGDAGIEPAKREWATLTVSEDNVGWLDEALDEERCLPAQVDYVYEDEIGSVTQTVTLERETVGTPAQRDPNPQPTTSTVISAPTGLTPMSDIVPPLLRAGVNDLIVANTDGYMYLCANFQTAPVWSRYSLASLGMSGSALVAFIVEPHSPGYLGTGTAIHGLIASDTHAYSLDDMFDAPVVANSYALRYTSVQRSMQGTRLTEGVFAIASHEDDGKVDVDYTADRGQSYSRTSDLGTAWPPGSGDSVAPGIMVSEHVADKIVVSAYDSAPAARLKSSTDAGSSWGNTDGNTFNNLANAITIPFQNSAETVIIHGGGSSGLNFGLFKTVSGVQTDISPVVAGDKYGPIWNFGVKTCDIDQNTILLVGYNEASTKHGVFLSRNQGGSWTTLIAPSTSVPWQGCNIAGDDPNTFFLLGADGSIAMSTDGGATFVDKSSNIPTDFPSAGDFINLAGRG